MSKETKVKKEASFFEAVWDMVSSVKLALVLFFILAVASIIGTLIQQKAEPTTYLRQYGETTFKIFKAIGFLDLYHSPWFIGLLVVFSLNLIVCSIRRFPRAWKQFRTPGEVVLEETVYKSMSQKEEFQVKGECSRWEGEVEKILKENRYELSKNTSADARHLLAQKGTGVWMINIIGLVLTLSIALSILRDLYVVGILFVAFAVCGFLVYQFRHRISYIGVYITHSSILFIFLGVIIGAVWGFNGYVNIVEGQAVDSFMLRDRSDLKKLGFSVRCDDFTVNYYEGSNRPKDFISNLTVLENGQSIFSKQIVVNDPLIYKDIYFYQSSYGIYLYQTQEGVTGMAKSLKLLARRKDAPQDPGELVELKSGSRTKFGDLEMEVTRFIPDFVVDQNMQVTARSPQLVNPAVKINIYPPKKPPVSTWIFAGMMGFHPLKDVPYEFAIADVSPMEYTGLQVAKDPGVAVVWIGCYLMMWGLMIAFTSSYRRVWVKLTEGEGKIIVKIAGSANKNRPAFEREFEEIKAKINASQRP